MNGACRVSGESHPGWDVFCYYCSCPNNSPFTDPDSGKDDGSGAYERERLNDNLSSETRTRCDVDAITDHAVVVDRSGSVDDDGSP